MSTRAIIALPTAKDIEIFRLITRNEDNLLPEQIKYNISNNGKDDNDTIYFFQLSYNDAKQIPEVISLYTTEAREYKDRFSLYVNIDKENIEWCELVDSDGDYTDVDSPAFSEELIKALVDKAKCQVGIAIMGNQDVQHFDR